MPLSLFLGELLIRLNPPGHERFLQAGAFHLGYTGAEANSAVALAQLGMEAGLISAVPEHDLGQACVNHFRRYGVGTAHVLRREGRLGIFYIEAGASQRASNVIYDRTGTVFSELQPGDFDWSKVFAGAAWLHWSGTAPALGPGLPALIADACRAAQQQGLTVSCDLNFRSKLWDAERARAVMRPLMQHVDVLIGNEEHIASVLGIAPSASDSTEARIDDLCTRLHAAFPFEHVAVTTRETLTVNEVGWRCFLSDGAGVASSRTYRIVPVDAVGAGDAFTAGLIYGLRRELSMVETVEFAAAAGCLKHSIPGDLNLANEAEIRAVMRGESGLRIRR